MSPNIFFTADMHLGHKACLYHDKRPWATVEEMDAAIIATWNAMVGRQDTIYIVGDAFWKFHSRYLGALNGKKTLIVGTHDKQPIANEKLYTGFIGGRHRPGILEVLIDKQPVTLCHYPLSTWAGSCYGSWLTHGHSHGGIPEQPDYLRCDIGMPVWNYAPVPWEVLKMKMESRVPAWKERRKLLSNTHEEHQGVVEQLKLDNEKWRNEYARYINVPEQEVPVARPVLPVSGD